MSELVRVSRMLEQLNILRCKIILLDENLCEPDTEQFHNKQVFMALEIILIGEINTILQPANLVVAYVEKGYSIVHKEGR